MIARDRPETGPWLALVEVVLDEMERSDWDEVAAGAVLASEQPAPVALLTGATVTVPSTLANELVRRLVRLAGNASAAGRTAANGGPGGDVSTTVDAFAVMAAACDQDHLRMGEIAERMGIEPATMNALGQLVVTPLLQACRRRFATAVPADWEGGSCPICAAWPVLAESRGLERTQVPRCARCGAGWRAVPLRCVYCGTGDHRDVGSLLPAEGGEARRVETCDACHGYLKVIATLRPWPGEEVGLADLSTVELDLAALERGFSRPETPAAPLGIRFVAAAAANQSQP